MTLQWTSKSRFGDARHFTYDMEKQEVTMTCDHVLYVSYGGRPGKVTAVDPDGGPYLTVGGLLYTVPSGPILKILRILSYSQPRKGLEVTLGVRVEKEAMEENKTA